jgi:prophage regulatory protein
MDLDPSVVRSPCSQLEGNLAPVILANVPLRPIRFIRLPEVMSRTAFSKMTIRRWEGEGAFPKRCKIGKNLVAWVEAEIDDWCEKRAAGEPWGGEQ